jgi:hypothetical protein
MPGTKKQFLQELKKKCAAILDSPCNTATQFGCSTNEIHEIRTLMTSFAEFDLEVQTLRRTFDRYHKLKQFEKRKFAWDRVIDSLYRINVTTTYLLGRMNAEE